MDRSFSLSRPVGLTGKAALSASGFFALFAGTTVYLLDRDWASTLFLAPFSTWQPDLNLSLGLLGSSLPSFCHAYAFALLIILVLWPARHARLIGATLWLVVACGFESVQADTVRDWVANGVGMLAGSPLVDSFLAYSANGRFDVADLLATGLGVSAAFFASSILEGKS